MKRHLILIFLTLVTLQVHAQEREAKHTIGAHAGFSWIGVFTNMATHYNIIADINTTVTPAFTLSYDWQVMDRITVGGAVSRQRFSLRYRNYEYEDENGNERTGNFSTHLTRMNFAVRGLYHYLRSEKRELYAGIRIGINSWSLDTSVKDPQYDVSRYLKRFLNYGLGATPSVQFILFGFKGYFTPNFGANIETAIGAPHFISFGLIYRW